MKVEDRKKMRNLISAKKSRIDAKMKIIALTGDRKKLKIRRERNESKKVRKQFFKTKDELNDNDNVPDKQKQFYADLFKKDEAKPITEKKKKKEKKSDKS